MECLPNIEKSAFRRFEYVGYAGGRVYRVRKHGCGGWEAWLDMTRPIPVGMGMHYLRAGTLAELSAKLAERCVPQS
jgi:hypothetical protein